MSDQLIEHLYNYAQEVFGRQFWASREYRENVRLSETHLTWLRAHLPPEALGHLEAHRSMAELAEWEEERTLFLAGLSMGLSLGQLAE